MLTDVQIKNLPLPEKRKLIPIDKISGLYLIHQPTGAKSWAVWYRVNGIQTKFTLGSYPTVSLKTARKRALEAKGAAAGGKDLAAEKRAAREARHAAHATADRVDDVIGSFVKKHLANKAKPSWATEAERLLRVEIIPKFGKRRLGEIRDTDIHALLEEIVERAPTTANRTFAVFRKMCNWAMSLDGGKLINLSPCVGVEAPAEERRRDRVLSNDEIRLGWRAFESIGWPFGPICKLLLLTGARRAEVAGMKWSELDLSAEPRWTIPGERTKNEERHEIPLSVAAVQIIKALPRVEGKAGLVFSTTGETAVSGFSRAKAAIDKFILEILGGEAEARGDDPAEIKTPEQWQVHDLRRTVATNLQKLGVKLEVTEAVLNHVSGSRAGIVGVYQRHEYAEEKRAALDAWARRLETIVTGAAASNIVELAKVRG
jgi:integrase